jgi:hypothetical protein
MSKAYENKRRFIWRRLVGVWCFIVAGFPLYYLMPDRDWNYEYWGAPEHIIESDTSPENPFYQDEGVYTRIFIARPSAVNMQRFDEVSATGPTAGRMNKLLQQYELPRPWRYGDWHSDGSGDVVVCGNGLLLVADYNRNKGGLFSSRITPEIVWQHYPLRFRIAYAWAALGLNLLMLTPFLAVPAALCYLLYRVLAAFCRMFRKTFLTR